MYTLAWVVILLAFGHAIPHACAFLFDSSSSHTSAWGSHNSHCTRYAEYNTLTNLMTRDECMNIDSVFELLFDITTKEDSGLCRIHVIELLSDYFGANAKTPSSCTCQGTNQLHDYHEGHIHGEPDLRSHCFSHDSYYGDMFNQFFKSSYHHYETSTHIPACRTHHSVWSQLSAISTHTYEDSSCQRDIIFHLQHYFAKHTDSCTCTATKGHAMPQHTNGQLGSGSSHCLSYSSYNALRYLGNSNGCLSANSVWHYLDDLQVKSPSCRQEIQMLLADKYTSGSHYDNACVCTARRTLVNHDTPRLNNGSHSTCKSSAGTYSTIEADLFSHITRHGCRNHNYLWTKLQGIQNHCKHYHHDTCEEWIDCTQDLIVRAAIQYPNDLLDSCVCSLVSTTTSTTKTTPTTTLSSTTTTTTSTTAAPTTSQPKKFTCNALLVVEKIAQSEQAKHQDASACDPNLTGSDDAYVLSSCNITSPMTWRKGANVMADCESKTHLVPGFSPISTFSSEKYQSLGSKPGVFLECYNTGFKMAIQKCGGVPEIVHIENSHDYYVIV